VTVGATGPLIEVNLGSVTAVDAVTGSITPVVNPAGPYTSGVHMLSWSATDAAGNRSNATQKLTVKPQASLTVNQTVGEGITRLYRNTQWQYRVVVWSCNCLIKSSGSSAYMSDCP